MIINLTLWEKQIIEELKKKRKDGGISKDNLKVLTKKHTYKALEQSIKMLRTKIKKNGIEDYIFIEYKKWEKVYNLSGKIFSKGRKKVEI